MSYHARVTLKDLYDPLFRSDYQATFDISLNAVNDSGAIAESEERRREVEKKQPAGRTVSIEIFKKIA